MYYETNGLARLGLLGKLSSCPFCGSDALHVHDRHEDERSGYGIKVTINCHGCPANISAHSIKDRNGWCTENAQQVAERAAQHWNRRA
ncbi:hypothetical protein HOS22_gp35 [Rhizobium phage RHEph08]|uniref:Restriction alleviation protein, Lar family n=1 Tax=Rhizobium phage RHEph08 TaxID=1220715 RepID=L7TNR5_9CAUD|nr:hypothetical protein HOS22_gp35 [Rhizobium phage RHEph08]AGC35959.1 hypothetical protein RHEph08_gp035 [Rhizobium phage RHEph08]